MSLLSPRLGESLTERDRSMFRWGLKLVDLEKLPPRHEAADRAKRVEPVIAEDCTMGIHDFAIVTPRSDNERACTECFLIKPKHLVADSVCVDCAR